MSGGGCGEPSELNPLLYACPKKRDNPEHACQFPRCINQNSIAFDTHCHLINTDRIIPEKPSEGLGPGNLKLGGAPKYDGDKLRYDLLPPHAIKEVVLNFTIGARKYGPWKWLESGGFEYSRLIAAIGRHLAAWVMGEERDPEEGFHHLSAICFYSLLLMEHERLKIGVDDRPYRIADQVLELFAQVRQEEEEQNGDQDRSPSATRQHVLQPPDHPGTDHAPDSAR